VEVNDKRLVGKQKAEWKREEELNRGREWSKKAMDREEVGR
jgi:hypothetical protein